MFDKFEEYVDDFMDKRLDEVSFKLIETDDRYKEIHNKLRELSEKLIGSLNRDYQQLFIEFEEYRNALTAMLLREIYQTGFRDGVRADLMIKDIKR